MHKKTYFALVTIFGFIGFLFLHDRFISGWKISSLRVKFPSIKNEPSITVDQGAKDINIVKFEEVKNNFQKGLLRFDGKNVSIFVHGKEDLISASILNTGAWEGHWMNQFVKYIKQNPGIQVLDIGCNIGVYTLIAAALGSKVIAVDANKNNTDRLIQSVMAGKFVDRVKIFLNAVSNERKTFSMNLVPSNIGGQSLSDNTKSTYQVKSIFLDDLLPFLDIKGDVIMKMDIENHETKAIRAAGNLFNMTNIKLILMEWFHLKALQDSYVIMCFFLNRNYRPYADFFSTTQLDISNYKAWPIDVVWRRS